MSTIKDLLTVDAFLEERPTMTTYSEDEIQEAINSSAQLLDALCNGLISQVCEFNLVDDRTTLDTTDTLYRTDFEMNCLTTAFVLQTQYTINLGNDYTVGSSSMSTGGLNASFQRPESRDVYAPAVKEQLQAARVYVMQDYFGFAGTKPQTDWSNYFMPTDVANNRFLAKYQPSASSGNVLTIDDNNMVTFSKPADINFAITEAKNIYDPNDNEYKLITEVDNLAWISGTNKNVNTPSEVDDKIETALNKLPVIKLISVYGGQVLAFQNDSDYQDFKKRTNTTDDNFKTLYLKDSTWIYKYCPSDIYQRAAYELDSTEIDLTVNESFKELVQTVEDNKTTAHTELMDEVGVLTELVNNVETQLRSEITSGDTTLQTNIDNLKTELEQTISDGDATLQTNIDNLESSINTKFEDYVDLTSTQTISGAKTFNYGTKTAVDVSGSKTAYIAFNKGSTRYGYVGLGASGDNILRLGSDQDQPIYLQPSNGVIYANGRITSLSTPTSDNDAATKQYVDDAIAGGTTANYATVEQLNTLDTKVDTVNMTLQSNIDTNTTNINALGETLEQWVTLNDDATIIKDTTFTTPTTFSDTVTLNGNNLLTINGNTTAYITFQKNGTTYGYVGMTTYKDNIMRIASEGDRPIYLQAGNGVVWANGRITALDTPTKPTDATTKTYVDNLAVKSIWINANNMTWELKYVSSNGYYITWIDYTDTSLGFPSDFNPDTIINCWFPNDYESNYDSSVDLFSYRWFIKKSTNQIVIKSGSTSWRPTTQLIIKYAG